MHQRVPYGDAGAWQRRGFLERQVLGHTQQAVGREHRVLSQRAIEREAERGRRVALRECRDDAIAGLELRYAGPDGRDLAGPIRQRDRVLRQRAAKIFARDDREIAEVQRRGAHAHEHLPRAGARSLALGPFEPVESRGAFGNEEDFHGRAPLAAFDSSRFAAREQFGRSARPVEEAADPLGDGGLGPFEMEVMPAGHAIDLDVGEQFGISR